MKFALLLTLLFSIIFITSFGYEERDYKDPKHPGKCVIKPDAILSEGEAMQDPSVDCGEIHCGKDGEAMVSSCSDLGIDPPRGTNCTYAPPDLTKNFPSCCVPQVQCESYD